MIIFAAIKLPPFISRELSRYQKGIAGAKWSGPEKLHITLGYFGDIPDETAEALDAALADRPFPSFEISLSGGGHFGKSDPHAVWAGVKDSPDLTALHEHCKRAARRAGVTLEKRLYRPHVTLAYLKPMTPYDRIIAFEKRLADFETKPFLVDAFYLFSSHRKLKGPNLYRIEASYPLLGRSD